MPDTHGKLTKEKLKERWETPVGKAFTKEIIRQLTSNLDDIGYYNVNWEKMSVTINNIEYLWEDFNGVKEIISAFDENKPLSEKWKNEEYGDLRGISFEEENWNRSKPLVLNKIYLSGIHAEYSNLNDITINKSKLDDVNFQESSLRETRIINHSFIRRAHFEKADCTFGSFKGSDLFQTHFEGTNLYKADFENAHLNEAHFNLKSWWQRVLLLKKKDFPFLTVLTGADIKNCKLDTDPVLYRELLDEQFLDKFAEKHKILYPFWLLTSNCGRSLSLVLLWSFFIAIIFGFIFIPLDFKHSGTTQLWHPFYFSFVTMTTLGLASVEPVSFWAALWHIFESVIGYLLLGYAISVLGSKLTRRSA